MTAWCEEVRCPSRWPWPGTPCSAAASRPRLAEVGPRSLVRRRFATWPGRNALHETLGYLASARPGVDLVAGHSVHVPHGTADGVCYDLGDFVDDYKVHPQLRNDLGLLFLITLDGGGASAVSAVPLAPRQRTTALPSAGIDLWKEDRDGAGADMTTRGPDVAAVRRAALPLGHPADLEPLLDRIGSARLVLLGEASHGTSEFYRWRAELTRRLVTEKGFSFVGVEGDWPDCHRVHCSVVGASGAPADPREALAGFARWPRWMWANEEVVEFARWLRGHNDGLEPQHRVGFHAWTSTACSSRCARCWTTSPSTNRTICPRRGRRCAASSPTARTRSPTRWPAGWCRRAARRRSSRCCAS